MMRQYREWKARYHGAILFFRLGDFYEMFEEDAVEVSRLLGLTLTQRQGVPMCGVPYHASEGYIKRLLQFGKKVAICEQISEGEGPGKKLFERRVTEVLTPGSLTQDEYLEPSEASFALSLYPRALAWGIALWDVSAGEVWVGSCQDQGEYPELQKVLERFHPREVIFPPRSLDHYPDVAPLLEGIVREEVPNSWFEDPCTPEEGFLDAALSEEGESLASLALRGLGRYLMRVLGDSRPPLNHIHELFPSSRLILDPSTLRNLELVLDSQQSSRASLLAVLDHTLTPPGARYLRQELVCPPADLEEVEHRLGLTEWFVQRPSDLQRLRSALQGMGDLERILARLELDRASPWDLLALGSVLERSLTLIRSLTPPLPLDSPVELLEDLSRSLHQAIHPQASRKLQEGPRMSDTYDEDLSRWRRLAREGERVLEEIRDQEAAETGLPLKLKYNRVLGYFYELTRLQAADLPARFLRRQSLSQAERFTSERLLRVEAELAHSREAAEERDLRLFLEFRQGLKASLEPLRALARWLKQLDFHQALAEVALRSGWTRPTLVPEPILEVQQGRHPVVERFLPSGAFVPNDLSLSEDSYFRFVTGPNMAGKSTFLRQNALIVLLAHLGSYVPALRAVVGLADKIFCRVGAQDRLARGDSTFLVEMKETAYILKHATRRSFIVLDEVGRGTSTQDGLALAQAVSEYLLQVIRARTLFSTHFHELTRLEHPALANLHMEVSEQGGEVLFLRRALPGAARSSYGVHAARLAGIPESVLQRAEALLAQSQVGADHVLPSSWTVTELFSPLELLGSEILSLELEDLSPRQALELLWRLHERYRNKK